MTWTYAYAPSTVPLDAIRMLVGDVDECDQQLQDEELQYLLDVDGSASAAAASACRMLAARYASKAESKQVGDLRIQHGDRAKRYLDLARELETRGAAGVVAGMAGGLSRDRRDEIAEDTDRIPPTFYKGIHDDPSALGRDVAGDWGWDLST